jgi:Family of unknown function (DUF6221)
MGLAEFFAARLDEDAEAARFCSPAPWQASPRGTYVDDANGTRLAGLMFTDDGLHIARYDPARVLREVEAKRQILAEHERRLTVPASCGRCFDATIDDSKSAGTWMAPYPCRTLRLLAAVYADHPDYDPAWKD